MGELTLRTVYGAIAPMKQVVALLAEETDAGRIADFAKAVEAARRIDSNNMERGRYWGELSIWSTRRLGELLSEMLKQTGGDAMRARLHDATELPPTLEDLGIEKTQAHRAQRLASIPEEAIQAFVAKQKESGEEITKAGLLRAAVGAHVGHNSGENEWYTPTEYIAAALATMGSIDLDPASTKAANMVVQAGRYYTDKDDGLSREWSGNVWLNPPYSQPAVGLFSEKLAESVESKAVAQACVLVNNATETKWFQRIASVASMLCFPAGRVKFWHPDRESAPLQGQAVLYCGKRMAAFTRAFRDFGIVAETK